MESTSTPATDGTPVPNPKWENTIEPLVRRLKLDAKAVTHNILVAKLVEAADDNGADVLTDPEAVDLADFRGAFPSVAKGSLNLAIKEIRAKGAPAPAPAKAEAVPALVGASVNATSV